MKFHPDNLCGNIPQNNPDRDTRKTNAHIKFGEIRQNTRYLTETKFHGQAFRHQMDGQTYDGRTDTRAARAKI